MPPKSTTRLVLAGVLLAAYTLVVLFVVFWPTPIDQDYRSAITKLLNVLHRNGVPEWFGYNKLEFSANIAMFIPLGFLVALVLPSRIWWLALVICLGFSIAIELTQGAFLDQRFSSPFDVLANTLGGIVGTLFAVVLRAIVYQRDQVVIDRAMWERSHVR